MGLFDTAKLTLPEPFYGSTFTAVFTARDGTPRAVTEEDILSAQGSIEQRGGYSSLSMRCIRRSVVGYIRQGDTVIVRHLGYVIWEGEVTFVRTDIDKGVLVADINAVGFLFAPSANVLCQRKMEFPGGSDIGFVGYTIWSSTAPLSKRLNAIHATFDLFNQTITSLFADGMLLREALIRLSQSPESGDAAFGAYKYPSGTTMVFGPCDPLDNPTAVYAMESPQLMGVASEDDGTEAFNAITILGGTPNYPNFIKNSRFSSLVGQGNGRGNLILNGDFESNDYGGSNSVAYWTLHNAAALKDSTGMEGAAHSGRFMIEIDHNNEYFSQVNASPDEAPVAGDDYAVSIWFRAEQDVSDIHIQTTFSFINSSYATVGTTLTQDLHITSAQWDQWKAIVTAPTGAVGVSMTVHGTSGLSDNGHGALFDDAGCYRNKAVEQEDWEYIAEDPASFTITDNDIWHPDKQCGSVYFETSNVSDADGADARFQMNPDRVAVGSGQKIRWTMEARAWTGVTAPKVFFEVNENHADGTGAAGQTIVTVFPSFFTTDWKVIECVHTLAGDTPLARPNITLRSNGGLEIRRPCLRNFQAYEDLKQSDSTFPTSLHGANEATYDRYFVRNGDLRLDVRAADVFSSGDVPMLDVVDRGTVWGQPFQLPSIITEEDARQEAKLLITRSFEKSKSVTLRWASQEPLPYPGESILLIGAGADNYACGQNPMIIRRIQWEWRPGSLILSLSAGATEKDDAERFADLINRRTEARLRGAGYPAGS